MSGIQFINNHMGPSIYDSDGQSAARGLHAALGYFCAARRQQEKHIHCAALSEILRHLKISNLTFMQIFLQLLIDV